MCDVISVQGLGKQFRCYHVNRPTTLQEAFTAGFRWLRPADRFWALRDISFALHSGRMLGVLGSNGAGKSTLLRLLGGIGRPDEGHVKVQGRIGGLLELGAGFHPDLTGRENVFINGIISGLTRRDVEKRFEAIVAFAELEEAIDNPLRTYSTGMRMRLGFAVAVHTDPEILLIDEVLAVGDVAFRRKCFERINLFKNEGHTIVFVSHETNQILNLCDEALWLHGGRIADYGDPDEVVSNYTKAMDAQIKRRAAVAKPVPKPNKGQSEELYIDESDFSESELKIVRVQLLDQEGLPVTELDSGAALRVEIEYLVPRSVKAPIFGVSIHRSDHELCCRINTAAAGLKVSTLQGRERITLHFERLELVGGQYYFNVGVYGQGWDHTYDYQPHVRSLLIRSTQVSKGVLLPPHHWEIDNAAILQESHSAQVA